MLHGLLVHPDLDAPGEAAAPALVAVCLVDHASLTLSALAAILPAPSDGSLEEASAAVTREDAVMLPGGEVSAHLTRNIVQDAAIVVMVVYDVTRYVHGSDQR